MNRDRRHRRPRWLPVIVGAAVLGVFANGCARKHDVVGIISDPVDGSPSTTTFAAVSAGWFHTCAVADTRVYCWGSQEDQQLGDGSAAGDHKASPTLVVGLPPASSVSAGAHHSCAVTEEGLWCWGGNWFGMLGDGTVENRSTPVAVVGLPGTPLAVTASHWHSCALTQRAGDQREVWCWGENSANQVGASATDRCSDENGEPVPCQRRPAPVEGLPLEHVIDKVVSFGNHSCARSTAGAIFCWGENQWGAIGGQPSGPGAVRVAGLQGPVKAIAAAGFSSCVVDEGGLECWGENWYGMLGDGSFDRRDEPSEVLGLGPDEAIAAVDLGQEHGCVVQGGRVLCWGRNDHGQAAQQSFGTCGNAECTPTAVPVQGLPTDVTAIAAGRNHTCATSVAGRVYCWGDNTLGQLGIPTLQTRRAPAEVAGIP